MIWSAQLNFKNLLEILLSQREVLCEKALGFPEFQTYVFHHCEITRHDEIINEPILMESRTNYPKSLKQNFPHIDLELVSRPCKMLFFLNF